MALWGGRFESGPDALFRALNDSLRFDYRFALEDIDGSLAWANAIHRAGVLSADEVASLRAALTKIRGEIEADPTLPITPEPRDEDIHSYIERRLVETVGALGKKLHTGRSRNDQVATDFRLWTRRQIDLRLAELMEARRSLLDLAYREIGTVLPGYTHLQRAQPVLMAHWALAHEAMLARDTDRLRDARRRVNVCPLGSAALAGTAYAIDRTVLAKELGFDSASTNSLDATSDRDFVLETLAVAAISGVHLSRLGEDLILYGTQEFGFLEFDDAVSSGSSLMPQKKNPDSAELLRGKSGRLVGSLVSLLVTVKGLPLAYNKDLQEDKEPLFESMEQWAMSLRVVPKILDTLKVRREACERAAQGGYSNATDLADYLVSKSVPFREAHDIVGRIVRHGISRGLALEALPLSEMAGFCDRIGPDVFERISLSAGFAKREVAGGTGPKSVAAALDAAKRRLATERAGSQSA